MATPKITVRELRLTDMPSFVELCKSRDGLDSDAAVRRGEIVKHIAFRNPSDDGKPTYVVGVQDDNIVAHLGRMPTRFCVNGTIEHGSYFHDLYVQPEIRQSAGQGFFLSMKLYKAAEAASSGFAAMIWTNEINIALQTARKYHQMWTRRLVKLLTLDEKIDSVMPAPTASAIKFLSRQALSGLDAARRAQESSSVVIETVDTFDDRFDELANQIRLSKAIAPYKDRDYLDWKYSSRPGLNPTVHTAVDTSGHLEGFSVVVVGEPDAEHRSVLLAEFIVPGEDPRTMRKLLDASIQTARAEGAHRMLAVATEPNHHAALSSRFFMARGPRDPLFLANSERSSQKNHIMSIENWHMSFGDSEGPF